MCEHLHVSCVLHALLYWNHYISKYIYAYYNIVLACNVLSYVDVCISIDYTTIPIFHAMSSKRMYGIIWKHLETFGAIWKHLEPSKS